MIWLDTFFTCLHFGCSLWPRYRVVLQFSILNLSNNLECGHHTHTYLYRWRTYNRYKYTAIEVCMCICVFVRDVHVCMCVPIVRVRNCTWNITGKLERSWLVNYSLETPWHRRRARRTHEFTNCSVRGASICPSTTAPSPLHLYLPQDEYTTTWLLYAIEF